MDIDNDSRAETAIKFFDRTGSFSFAPGDGSGICEVCHTNTAHFQDDGISGSDPDHGNVQQFADANPDLELANCLFCHDHKDGFRPSCPDCHGLPPTNQAVVGGPDGRVGPVHIPAAARWTAPATGSATVGQHGLHATASGYNYPCQTCHMNGMSMTMTDDNHDGNPATPDHPDVDNQIQVGFDIKVDDFASYPAKKNINGTGVTYKGQTTLSGYTYQGTNNTTVNTAGGKTCANVYCHMDGKVLLNSTDYAPGKYPPNYAMGNISAPWDNPAYDPQSDGNKCNNCHDYPPRYDSHRKHYNIGISSCDLCHGTTASNTATIIDKSRHANGVYDVVAGGYYCLRDGGAIDTQFRNRVGPPHHTETRSGNLYNCYTHSFTYTPAPGGGTCSNLICHQAYSYSNPKVWGNAEIPQEISKPGSTWVEVGNQQCGVGGPLARTLEFRVAVTAGSCTGSGCVTPFKLYIDDWGDGTSGGPYEASSNIAAQHNYTYSYNPVCDPDHASYNSSDPSCPVNPSYNASDPACTPADPSYDKYKRSCYPILIDHQDRAYNITWRLYDAEGIPMAGQPATTTVVTCPDGSNVLPVIEGNDFSYVFGSLDYDLVVRFRARDADYNKGSHSGNGKVRIEWGGYPMDGGSDSGVTEAEIPLTNVFTIQFPFSFQYSRSAYYIVKVGVKDNDPKNTTWVWAPNKLINVTK